MSKILDMLDQPMTADERIGVLEKILNGAPVAVRRAAIKIALEGELESARDAYRKAHQAGEAYKAKLITGNAKGVKGCAERLDEAVEVFMALNDVAALAVQAASVVEDRHHALQMVLMNLREVCGPWSGQARGLEHGAGLSAYDEPDNVKRVKAEALAACARHQRHGSDKA